MKGDAREPSGALWLAQDLGQALRHRLVEDVVVERMEERPAGRIAGEKVLDLLIDRQQPGEGVGVLMLVARGVGGQRSCLGHRGDARPVWFACPEIVSIASLGNLEDTVQTP